MKRTRTSVGIAVVLALSIALASRVPADSTQPTAIVRIDSDLELDAVGNASGRSEIVLPQGIYQGLKRLMSPRYTVTENGQQVTRLREPKIENVLRFMGLSSTGLEVKDIKGEFDDDAATINVSYRVLGRVGFHQGQWVYNLRFDPDLKADIRKADVQGESASFEFRHRDHGVQMINRINLKLPKGATQVEFHKESYELVYSAPVLTIAKEKQRSRPELRFDIKPQIMSAVYKLYANPKWLEMWTARCVFQNDTAETLTDFRARFHIDGYSAWTTWKRTGKVFPGQTVVDAFYPIIDAKVAQLKGSTPAEVELEYEYTRPNGEKVTESESRNIKILGMNEALWSSLEVNADSTWYDIFRNGPMVLASFTSANDPVILDVLGMVSKATGGTGNSLSDEGALKFMGTLYNLFRQNIAYETTPGGYQPDGLSHQYLKYGRDVLRSRSGTCVNLSILYASVCEAAGLQAFIVMGPGHAFAAAKLPQSGLPVFVETTGCGGGTKKSSMTFVQARESAFRTYQQWTADGVIQETDIQASRQNGISPPELPDIGPNPLKEWGLQPPEPVDQVYLPKLLINVKSALDAAKIRYHELPDRPAVQIDFKTEAGNEWSTVTRTMEDTEIMLMMSHVPGKVPEFRRKAVASALAEFNANLIHGNFELSKQGTISFRTTTDVRGGLLVPRMVQNEIDHHFNTMQKYLPDLRKLTETTASTTSQSHAAAPQPPVPVPADSVLIGNWKTLYADAYGNQIAQAVALRADGTYNSVAANGSGAKIQERGRWTIKDNLLTAVSESGQSRRTTIRVINKNRVLAHDLTNNIDLDYQRIEP
jgi:hypothetical protein